MKRRGNRYNKWDFFQEFFCRLYVREIDMVLRPDIRGAPQAIMQREDPPHDGPPR